MLLHVDNAFHWLVRLDVDFRVTESDDYIAVTRVPYLDKVSLVADEGFVLHSLILDVSFKLVFRWDLKALSRVILVKPTIRMLSHRRLINVAFAIATTYFC